MIPADTTWELSGFNYGYVGDLVIENGIYDGIMAVVVRWPLPDTMSISSLQQEVEDYTVGSYNVVVESSITDTIGTYPATRVRFRSLDTVITGLVAMCYDSSKTALFDLLALTVDYDSLINDLNRIFFPSVTLFQGTLAKRSAVTPNASLPYWSQLPGRRTGSGLSAVISSQY
jgi:hypothetical protein